MSFDHDLVVEGHQQGRRILSLARAATARQVDLIFHRAAHTFHKPYPGAAGEVLRVDVTPESLSHMETMAIEFPLVLKDEATMRIHWGETGVPIRIKAPFRPPA